MKQRILRLKMCIERTSADIRPINNLLYADLIVTFFCQQTAE